MPNNSSSLKKLIGTRSLTATIIILSTSLIMLCMFFGYDIEHVIAMAQHQKEKIIWLSPLLLLAAGLFISHNNSKEGLRKFVAILIVLTLLAILLLIVFHVGASSRLTA